MSRTPDPWRGARSAWERLNSWQAKGSKSRRTRPDDAASAVDALADIGVVRRLLDQAELSAVRAARRHGSSWAEIATQLGVTRQSAWERWRDLDEATDAGATARNRAIARESAVLVEEAQRRRRSSTVVVPNVVGMTFPRAREALMDTGLSAASPDPDGPPLTALGWPEGTVVDQSPEAGARVPPGSAVRLWLDRPGGGSAGVREPRRPKPGPRSARAVPDEFEGERVS